MNPLIAITEQAVGDGLVPTVDARELHAFLESGKDFTTWMRDRINQYGFAEGQDFVKSEVLSSPESGSAKARPQMRAVYALTLDMAKELAMVERNWRGRQARKYFIECEKRLREQRQNTALDLRDPLRLTEVALQLTGLVRELVEERKATAAALANQAPKAEFYDAFVEADGLYNLQNAGRALHLPPNKFIAWLKTFALFYQGGALVPYRQFIERGQFEVRTVRVGEDKAKFQTFVTPKGLAALHARWQREHAEEAA